MKIHSTTRKCCSAPVFIWTVTLSLKDFICYVRTKPNCIVKQSEFYVIYVIYVRVYYLSNKQIHIYSTSSKRAHLESLNEWHGEELLSTGHVSTKDNTQYKTSILLKISKMKLDPWKKSLWSVSTVWLCLAQINVFSWSATFVLILQH